MVRGLRRRTRGRLHAESVIFIHAPSPEIYTLSLHDALPICVRLKPLNCSRLPCVYAQETLTFLLTQKKTSVFPRSEERFSRNAETDLVCRLLLEKKKQKIDRIIRLKAFPIFCRHQR